MEKRILHSLETLIRFRTTTAYPKQKQDCIQWIESAFLTESGYQKFTGCVEECPYLLLLHPDARFLWFAHIDVVPAEDAQFCLTREGDTLRGRGVKDMKGAALPFFLAYKDACDEGPPPPVSILLSSDEEIGGATIPTLTAQGLKAPIAFTPDTGSAHGIVTEHKGALWIDLACRGTSGHGAMPSMSRNALQCLADTLQRLKDAFPTGSLSDWQMTVTPTMLKAGDAENRVPELATATLDVRYPSNQCNGTDSVVAALTPFLGEGCSLHIRKHALPLHTDSAHPFIQTFVSVVKEVEGSTPPFIREHGATDARHFCAAGIPAFLYGPRGGDLHGQSEWVSLASLLQQYAIYRKIFITL